MTALKELDIDIPTHYSKPYTGFPSQFVEDLDLVITLCAEEVCPLILTKSKKVHWPLIDPASEKFTSPEARLEAFRATRKNLF